MKEILHLMWARFKIVGAIIGDIQARAIATIFYFTILMPFGLIALFLSKKETPLSTNKAVWLDRDPVPFDLEAAKRQG
ncbi:MAG: hypothetical protein R3E39_03900 [Anaerolineae bacterium]